MTITEIRNLLAAQRNRIESLECCCLSEQLLCEQILTANLAVETTLADLEEYGHTKDSGVVGTTG